MIFNNNFILASSSSSRYKILKNNKLSFVAVPPRCNEADLKNKLIKKKTQIKKISLELARLKASSISCEYKNKLVVGSDTVINFQGEILNKAKNVKEAKNKITKMSGQTHQIYSAVSVFYNKKEIWNTVQKSTVIIRDILSSEVDFYLFKNKKTILNSVGCYQIELMGPNIIKDIKGDFFNVMGFPLFPFLNFLKEHKPKMKKK